MNNFFKRGGRVALLAVAALAVAVALPACTRSAESLDKQEDRDPLLRRARMQKNAQDIEGAIEWYNKALDRRPTLARAHLEVGLLYDKYHEDYIRAIYHYQRYIDLRPQAEKNHFIEELIDKAKLAYAASLPDRPSSAIEEIAYLKQEIARLKGELAAQNSAPAAKAESRRTTESAAGAAGLKPAPAQPAVETYRVQEGDTLSSIAAKVYNDSRKWEKIYDANRNALATPQSLRQGQTLIIPGL